MDGQRKDEVTNAFHVAKLNAHTFSPFDLSIIVKAAGPMSVHVLGCSKSLSCSALYNRPLKLESLSRGKKQKRTTQKLGLARLPKEIWIKEETQLLLEMLPEAEKGKISWLWLTLFPSTTKGFPMPK